MKNTRKPSRQVRRAAERRIAKRLAKKELEQNGNQKRKKTHEPDEPKRKFDWKPIAGIISALVKVAEFIRDTLL